MNARRRILVLAVVLLAGAAVALPLLLAPGRHAGGGPRPLRRIEGAKTTALALAFDRQGERVFMVDAEGVSVLSAADLRAGLARPTSLLSFAELPVEVRPRESLITSDGRHVVVSGRGGDIVPVAIIDVSSRTCVADITSACREIALSRDGRIAVTHDPWPTLELRIWSLPEGTSVVASKVSTGSFDVDPPALTLDVSPVTSLGLVCFRGATSVWDLASGQSRSCPVRLLGARFVGDSRRVVGFAREHNGVGLTELTVWDTASGELRVLWRSVDHFSVSRTTVSPHGRRLVAHRQDAIWVWSLDEPGEPRTYKFPGESLVVIGEPMPAVAFTPDERALVVSRVTGELFWLDLDD